MTDKREIRVGAGREGLDRSMTKDQAFRWGEKNMPHDLKQAGFKTVIFTADPEINGWFGYRVNYGK